MTEEINKATLANARDIANQIEELFHGEPTASCLYAIGMVAATAIAHAERRDKDRTMKLLSNIIDLEIAEIDRLHASPGKQDQ